MSEIDAPNQAPSETTEGPLPLALLRQMDFFQAVRVLQVLLRKGTEGHPIGLPGPLSQEMLRLRVSTSMAFPARDLESIEWETQSHNAPPSKAVLTTHFLGLVGADSPLPLSYVQEVLLEEDEHPQLRAFLDLFHHRLLSLLFRAWQKPRLEQDPMAAEGLLRQLADNAPEPSDQPQSQPQSLGPSQRLSLRHLGLLSLSTRPAEGLRLLLEEALGIPVRVVPLRLRRVEIPASERFRFGARERGHRLSRNLVLGRRIWDRSGAFTVEVGPLRRAQLAGFEPGGALVPELLRRAALYLEHPLEMRLELRVPPEEMPRVRLGGPHKTRLGRMAVLTRARTEVRVRIESVGLSVE